MNKNLIRSKALVANERYQFSQSKAQKPQRIYIISILLIITTITLIAYYPSLNNKFTNWDDGGYVVDNLELKNLNFDAVLAEFHHYHMGCYHPLTMLSLFANYYEDKLNPYTYHITNLIIHLLNTLLVFWLIFLLFARHSLQTSAIKCIKEKIISAAIVSVLFGIHTLGVESVAWISERKNLLYTLFFLFSLIVYIEYIKYGKFKYYLFSLFLFVFSLLSKGMAASLALTLILIDYYFNRNLLSRKIILEKIPFFILAFVFGVIALFAQKTSNAIQTNEHYFFYERFLFAGYGIFQYLIKLILPLGLSFFYNYPTKVNNLLPGVYYIYPVISVLIIIASVYYYRKSRLILFAIGFFLVNIILVLQIIPVGYAVIADRYTYISSIGFFILPAAFYKYLSSEKPKFQRLFSGLIIAYIILLSYFTNERSRAWFDGFSLWNAEIEYNPNSALAFKSRGRMKLDINDYTGAYNDFNNAIRLNPKYGEAYNGRGMAKGNLHDYKGAIEDLNKAIEYYPQDPLSWNNRGIARSFLKDYTGAVSDFDKAIKINPEFYNAYFNRALSKSSMNDHKGAINDLTSALNINPDYIQVYPTRGVEKLMEKDYQGAIMDFNKSLESSQNNPEIYFNRGISKYYLKDKSGCCEDWNTALNMGFAKAGDMIKMYCK